VGGPSVHSSSALPTTGPDARAAPFRRGTARRPGRTRSAHEPPVARCHALLTRVRDLVDAIQDGDDAMVQEAVLRLSRSRRWLAPLALTVGAFAMLFDGLKLVFSNWRLTLVQVLPATWIWLAMFDLKAHVLHGKSFHVLRGPIVIPLVAGIMAITVAAFFLNAAFAFAIARPRAPDIRAGFADARAHRAVVMGAGAAVGLLLGLSTVVVTRWGSPWFALSLSAVIGVMMVCYVTVPSRLIGVRPIQSRKDKLATSAVTGALGAAVSAPAYLLGRLGLLMLGSNVLFIPGVILVAAGLATQAGATGAVKAIKMSAHLVAGRPAASDAAVRHGPP
jgi:hypothetical protein